MKKHFTYLISAIIAVSLVFVSCSEDENGNNDYNENGYYNGGDNGNGNGNGDNGNEPPVCPPDCKDDCCYVPEPVDPCKEYEQNVATAEQDSIRLGQDFRTAKLYAIYAPNPIRGVWNHWWDEFIIAMQQNPGSFMDTVRLSRYVAYAISSTWYTDNPNLSNLRHLVDVSTENLDNYAILRRERDKLYLCRETNQQ